jgi:tetratricopeptide (TPR) repeat protein
MRNPDYLPYQRKKKSWLRVFSTLVVMAVAAGLLYQIPFINSRLRWRLDLAYTYMSMLFNPVQDLPTPAVEVAAEEQLFTLTPTETLPPTATPEPTATPIYTPTPTLVPTPIPGQVQLTPPAYDELRDAQALNNCGPATLALYLRFFGWEGDQYDISKIIKPEAKDRNVNVDELTYYVRNYSGWLKSEFRVGGDLETIKEILAAGIPVMIEEAFTIDRQYWLDDDQWSGHYLLITGYDDAQQMFTTHDTELGPNQHILYDELDDRWQAFNRVYIIVYPPEMENNLINVLGENWDVDTNRQNALETARRETEEDPQNAFAWFNLGTNLTYFESYNEAFDAYRTAITLKLPQRMLRYQFGPFIAYFHTFHTEDLLALTKTALQISRTSEEAMLWRGWAFYRQGDTGTALNYFRDALKINPNFDQASNAITYVQNN